MPRPMVARAAGAAHARLDVAPAALRLDMAPTLLRLDAGGGAPLEVRGSGSGIVRVKRRERRTVRWAYEEVSCGAWRAGRPGAWPRRASRRGRRRQAMEAGHLALWFFRLALPLFPLESAPGKLFDFFL